MNRRPSSNSKVARPPRSVSTRTTVTTRMRRVAIARPPATRPALTDKARPMSNEQQQAEMQLAFRTEGQSFNAYIERTDGEAPFIQIAGSINQGLCEADPLIRETWKRLMALAV